MKTLLVTLVMILCGVAVAKDPPKKEPHIYVVVAIYNKSSTTENGTTMYALLAKDMKGDTIVVGISKETVQQLQQLTEPTAIRYLTR